MVEWHGRDQLNRNNNKKQVKLIHLKKLYNLKIREQYTEYRQEMMKEHTFPQTRLTTYIKMKWRFPSFYELGFYSCHICIVIIVYCVYSVVYVCNKVKMKVELKEISGPSWFYLSLRQSAQIHNITQKKTEKDA